MPYLLNLPSGRSISVFFYDGPVSRAVAFEGLLTDGRRFAERLLGSYAEGHNRGHLIHIATDGETYGHHHRFGDMALAYALEHIDAGSRARFTNYGEYLSRFPPTREVEIFEETSWSCAHGIERWRSNCGCSTGGQPGWTQEWRAPLREGFDWLRDHLAPRYEGGALKLLKNPWAARDDYISVLLDRSPASVSAFLGRHATHDLSASETVEALKLLELQRSAMLMYTSCGWFFNEISGIESVQCLQYAGRALQITQDVFGESLHGGFLRILERARSNIPEKRDGARIFAGSVLPAVVDPAKVGAHYAIASLFQPDGVDRSVYCYDVHRIDYHSAQSGRSQLALGRATVASRVTHETADLAFGVLHVGDHNIIGGDRPFLDPDVYQSVVSEITEVYTSGDLLSVIRLLDKHFGGATYSLGSLFRDEQRTILNSILESALDDAEALNRQVYEHSAPMMRFVATLGHPRPAALHRAAELVLNADLRRLLTQDELDSERTQSLLAEAARLGVAFDGSELGFLFKRRLLACARILEADPGDMTLLQSLADAVKLARSLPFAVDLWEVQNIYWNLLHTVYPEVRERAAQDNTIAREWATPFVALGDVLGVRVPG
jgi:hypothetical protein